MRSGRTRWCPRLRQIHLAAALATSERHGHGIYLGASLDSAPALSRPVFAPPQQCVLLLGPPRSGKTLVSRRSERSRRVRTGDRRLDQG